MLRSPVVLDDHARTVRARFMAALEAGKSVDEATRVANCGHLDRELVKLPPPPPEVIAEVEPENAAKVEEQAEEGAQADAAEATQTEPGAAAQAAGLDASLANLDRDGDGAPGGSMKAKDRGDDLAALRDAARAKGVTVDMRWGAARLKKEIDAAQ